MHDILAVLCTFCAKDVIIIIYWDYILCTNAPVYKSTEQIIALFYNNNNIFDIISLYIYTYIYCIYIYILISINI